MPDVPADACQFARVKFGASSSWHLSVMTYHQSPTTSITLTGNGTVYNSNDGKYYARFDLTHDCGSGTKDSLARVTAAIKPYPAGVTGWGSIYLNGDTSTHLVDIGTQQPDQNVVCEP